MKKVCVITGGGSGMGFAAAKCMDKEKTIESKRTWNGICEPGIFMAYE